MAMTETDIKIIIAAELKKAGFDKAQKQTSLLDKSFKKLAITAAAAFSVNRIVAFGRASVKAFSDSEREAKLLANQLNAINLGFASPYLNKFIGKLALATGQTGGDLTNAFVTLSQATGDVTQAQKLLTTALDISLGTGKDLQTVVNALQRAYKGETTALSKLRIGYTATELKGRKFNDIIKELESRFKGSAANAVDSYAGKMARLSEAVSQAQEAFGEGLVSGLEQANISIEELQKNIIDLGNATGDLTADIVNFADKTIEAFNKIANSAPVKFLAKLLELISIYVLEPIVFGTGFGTPYDVADAKRRVQERAAAEKARSAELRSRNAILRAEKNNANKLAATKKKQAADDKKRERETLALKRAGTIFDLQNIQIVAAMQNKVTEDQRLRLAALLAINTGNAAAAEKLSMAVVAANGAALQSIGVMITAGDTIDTIIQKIITSQTNLALVGKGIGDIPKAPNPFQDWPSIIAGILAQIGTVKGALGGLGSPSIGGSAGGNNGNSGVGGDTVKVPSAIVPPAGVNPDTSLGGGFNINPNQYPNSSYFAGVAATSPYMSSSYFAGLAADSAAREEAAARRAAGPYMSSSYFAGMPSGQTTVNINVDGALDPYATARAIAEALNLEATTSGSFPSLGSSRAFGVK